MLSKPVRINNVYYNSAALAAKVIGVNKTTIRNRILTKTAGYTYCAYEAPKDRQCSLCKIIKPLGDFKKAKENRCGRSYWCKECQAADVLKHLQTEQGKGLSQNRFTTYRKTSTCKKARIRYKQGPAGKAAKARYAHQRRCRMGNVVNDLTALDWYEILQEQDNKCKICGRQFTEKLSPQRDHIIPVAVGGPFTKSNVQALCINCNSTKGARNWDMDGEPITDQDFQDLVHFEVI